MIAVHGIAPALSNLISGRVVEPVAVVPEMTMVIPPKLSAGNVSNNVVSATGASVTLLARAPLAAAREHKSNGARSKRLGCGGGIGTGSSSLPAGQFVRRARFVVGAMRKPGALTRGERGC